MIIRSMISGLTRLGLEAPREPLWAPRGNCLRYTQSKLFLK